MSPVSIETPGKHQDHVSCAQETYSYWNGWCSRMLSNFDNLPLSQPGRSPKGVTDAIEFWSLLMFFRQPSSFWALQNLNPNLQMNLCTVIQEKPGPPFPESPGAECPTGTAQASPPDRLQSQELPARSPVIPVCWNSPALPLHLPGAVLLQFTAVDKLALN